MSTRDASAGTPRMRRDARREQILTTAATAFAQSGFAGTGLDDVAAAAGVSRVILYRHFDSKADLYRAVLDRARARLAARVGRPEYGEEIIDALVTGADDDPDGFRLLFTHSAREPAFRAETDRFRAFMVSAAHDRLTGTIPDPAWARWAAHLAPVVTVAAVTAWLDADRPDPDAAAERIRRVLAGVLDAARGARPAPDGST